MSRKVEISAHEVCHDGFFRVERYTLRHELFAGGLSDVMTRELLERGDAVAILPYDPVTDQIVLIEQFRIGALRHYPDNPWLMEIVAGVMEDGESPDAVARREVEEETGIELIRLEPICRYLGSPGGTSEEIHLFCGQVDASRASGIHGLKHEHEDILVHVIDADQAMQWLETGRINSASPIIALQWFALHRKALRQRWLSKRNS